MDFAKLTIKGLPPIKQPSQALVRAVLKSSISRPVESFHKVTPVNTLRCTFNLENGNMVSMLQMPPHGCVHDFGGKKLPL